MQFHVLVVLDCITRSDFWIRETGTGEQVAQLHEIYIIIIIIIIIISGDSSFLRYGPSWMGE